MLKYSCDINFILFRKTILWQKCIVFAFIFPEKYLCKFVSQQSGMSILYAVPFGTALFFTRRKNLWLSTLTKEKLKKHLIA